MTPHLGVMAGGRDDKVVAESLFGSLLLPTAAR
jgi:hypothetical protein